jgi:hypothetical protein
VLAFQQPGLPIYSARIQETVAGRRLAGLAVTGQVPGAGADFRRFIPSSPVMGDGHLLSRSGGLSRADRTCSCPDGTAAAAISASVPR